MSSQDYVDQMMASDLDGQGNHLTAAAVAGHDGSILARSANFPQVEAHELTHIMQDLDEPTEMFIGGEKYMVIKFQAGSAIHGKKKGGGITIKSTKTAWLIGIYKKPVTPIHCNVVLDALAIHLISTGF